LAHRRSKTGGDRRRSPSARVARRIYDRLGCRREPELDFQVGEVQLLGYVLELD
jgi:hypothetical protein